MKFFMQENGTTFGSGGGGAFGVGGGGNVTNNNVIEPVKKAILFEKSATYFDNDIVPRRAHALLPRAKIVCTFPFLCVSFFILKN